ncbi:MAG: amino acid ABC transporter permease [Anaerolineae bacterium]
MGSRTDHLPPPVTSTTTLQWIRKNLFDTWYNALLTVISLWLIYIIVTGLGRWMLTSARWDVITDNLRLFMVGQYPVDQVWRIEVAVSLLLVLLGLSWGLWHGLIANIGRGTLGGFVALALLPFSLPVRMWLAASVVAMILAVGSGYGLRRRGARVTAMARRVALVGWILSFPASILLLRGIPGVPALPRMETSLWGGLTLTFLLAVVGIVASFPLGILLAIGRRSQMPITRVLCILFIELVRGVPLVTILFMSQVMLPLFLPQDIRIDRVIRAMVGITLFSAAYMAENVRGGLQAVPEGQIEAARALGLSSPLILGLIVLPQALRMVIPAIVGQFISLFKDTTLVAIIGLMEILNVGRAVLANPQYLGLHREVYLFVAAVFFIFSYAMSYTSYQVEARLGLGKR